LKRKTRTIFVGQGWAARDNPAYNILAHEQLLN